MKKQFSSLALAALMSTSSVAWAQTDTPTVVLVHGAFADGSSWSKVIPLLREKGLDVVSVQNPLSSLEADVDATRRAIDQVDGPVVLVGHSWAGVVITEAGNNPKVNSLVYVAAFVPDAGQSIASTPLPRTTHTVHNILVEDVTADSMTVLSTWTAHCFFHKLNASEVFFGDYRHSLRKAADGWKIARKYIVLKNDYVPTMLDIYNI